MDSDRLMLYGLMGLMLLAALAFFLPTLWRFWKADGAEPEEAPRSSPAVEALREEKRRLDRALREGEMDEAHYAACLRELERRVLVESGERQDETAAEMQETEEDPGVLRLSPWMLTLAVAAFLFAVPPALYTLLGAPELMRLAEDQKVLEGTASAESIRAYLKDNAGDGRAWILLAHRQVEADDFAGAVLSYREGRRVQPKVRNDPDIMLEFAAAILTAGNPADFPEAKAVLQEALDADPGNLKATELIVIAALSTEDWPLALRELRFLMTKMSPDNPMYMRYEEMARGLEAEIEAGRQAPEAQRP